MRVKAQKKSWMKMGVMWEASIINKNVNYRELAKKNLCRVYIVVETANNDMLKALCTKATTCKMLNCKINEEKYFFQTLPRQYDVIGKKILSSDSKIEDETKKKMYWERTGCWRFSFYSTSSHDSFHSFFPPLTLSLARSCSTFIPNSMHENKISFNNFSFNHLPQLDCYTRKTKVLSFAVSHFLFFSHHHFPFLFFIIITRSLLFSCKYLKSLMSSFEFNLCMKFAWVTKMSWQISLKLKTRKLI